MKAAITTGDGKVALQSIPKPKPGPGQILVKVIAAAQNPSEWMKVQNFTTKGVVTGHDYAGVVEEVGLDVPEGTRRVGERVAGFLNACMSNDFGGSFAEYTVADAEVLITLPDDISFEDAATLGLAGFTACQAIWQFRDLPTPFEPVSEEKSFPILIWGGATAVGQFTIQLAKLSGLRVITTASSKNQELLKQLGADAVIDYRGSDSEVTENIKAAVGNYDLFHAADCVGNEDSVRKIGLSFGKKGGHVVSVLPTSSERNDVKNDFPFVYTLLGKALEPPYPPQYQLPAIPEHYELGKRFGKYLSRLLEEKKLKTIHVKLVPNGLQDVQKWIEYQKEGKVSAEKIVYRIADTPQI
ncbi:dehydrogenase [Marasmius fiardii PR-910]|nr:dehydrogenase [Marasmius fiardii PR-910]